jgi:iron(III) transport system ATP-binding protein
MLTISNLVKTFRSGHDTVRASDDVSLEVQQGELVVLLGPSGCGKTTLLRCIAGLESAESGRIAFGDRVVYDGEHRIDVPPNKRNIGMVFQSYALWPHKTVRKNLAYPLAVRGMKRELRKEGWVEAAADLVDCGHLLERYPGQLSGGQQQRVALARGLVARPEILLFDEPLSNLDALLRGQVRNELHELHQRIGFTGVYVTHDQTEALALGDRLIIMRSGRLEQVGKPTDIYEHPVSEYAAHFVGYANRLVFKRSTDGWRLGAGDTMYSDLPIEGPDDVVHLRFRPEFALVTRPGERPVAHVTVSGTLLDDVYAGTHHELTVDCGGDHVTARVVGGPAPATPGETVDLHIPFRRARWFSSDGQALSVPTTVGV